MLAKNTIIFVDICTDTSQNQKTQSSGLPAQQTVALEEDVLDLKSCEAYKTEAVRTCLPNPGQHSQLNQIDSYAYIFF